MFVCLLKGTTQQFWNNYPPPEQQPHHLIQYPFNPPPAPYPHVGQSFANVGQLQPLPNNGALPQPAPLPAPLPGPLPGPLPLPLPLPTIGGPAGFPIQQPTITNTGETIIETLVGGIPFDCAGRPSGHWRDGKFCDIFHACVFGYQRKTYACPFSYGERTYFSEITRRYFNLFKIFIKSLSISNLYILFQLDASLLEEMPAALQTYGTIKKRYLNR